MTFAPELELTGRAVLVCGGGSAALGPVRALLDAGARVTVVGPKSPLRSPSSASRGAAAGCTSGRWTPAIWTGWPWSCPPTATTTLDQQVLALARAAGVPAAVPRPVESPAARSGMGSMILVGGGPGDPGLLTLAGQQAIRQADVIVCDRLAPLAALDQARPDAVIIDVAKVPRGAFTSQEQINEILVEHALRRPHGGPVEGRGQLRLRPRRRGMAGLRGGRHPGHGDSRGLLGAGRPGAGRHPADPPCADPGLHRGLRARAARAIPARPWTGRPWPGRTPPW